MSKVPKAVQFILMTAASCIVSKPNKLPKSYEKYRHIISESQAEKILHLDVEVLELLVDYAPTFIKSFEVCPNKLDQAIKNAQRRMETFQLENLFLKKLATYELMHRLFGMQTEEFIERRAGNGTRGIGVGRPRKCSEPECQLIIDAWYTQDEHTPEIERFLFVEKNAVRFPKNLGNVKPSPRRNSCLTLQ